MYIPQLDRLLDQERFSDSIENLFETRIDPHGPSYEKPIEANPRCATIHGRHQEIANEQSTLPDSQDALFRGLAKLPPKEAFENTVIRTG